MNFELGIMIYLRRKLEIPNPIPNSKFLIINCSLLSVTLLAIALDISSPFF